jgi:hypothetical protein
MYDELIKLLAERAAKDYDGHFTIMKFTTNWRVCFGTPYKAHGWDRGDIEMVAGATLGEAALKALANPQRVDCIMRVETDEADRQGSKAMFDAVEMVGLIQSEPKGSA